MLIHLFYDGFEEKCYKKISFATESIVEFVFVDQEIISIKSNLIRNLCQIQLC